MNHRRSTSDRAGAVIIAAGAALLAFHPIVWLVRTWVSPTYDSSGLYVFAAVCALFLWSVSSPVVCGGGVRSRAVVLIGASAAVRLASQILAVNVIGALTLVADVYALGLLASLDRRRRAISPAWLAAVFLLSLPLERVLQRLLGFPLQQVSAAGACALLRAGFEGVECEGVRLFLNGADVLVDLPCSGARGLLQLCFVFACLAAVLRPSPRAALAGLATVAVAGVASNALRIAVFAVGIGYRDLLGGVDVMSAPWHELVGLATVGLAAGALAAWCLRVARNPGPSATDGAPSFSRAPKPSLAGSLAFLAVCGAVVSVPSRPVDLSAPTPPPALPLYLDGASATPVPLTAREREYFTLYGGGAARARYGDGVLLLVSTTSPLRHLHAPDECLTGAGLDVSFLGVDRHGMPSAVYRAEEDDGDSYRVAVTYVSESGEMAASVAEVVWRWLHSPSRWSAVQRITSWESPEDAHRRFDDAVAVALDIPRPPKEEP